MGKPKGMGTLQHLGHPHETTGTYFPAHDKCQTSWQLSHWMGRRPPLLPNGLKHFAQGTPSHLSSSVFTLTGLGKGLGMPVRSERICIGAVGGAGGASLAASRYSSRPSTSCCCNNTRYWDDGKSCEATCRNIPFYRKQCHTAKYSSTLTSLTSGELCGSCTSGVS